MAVLDHWVIDSWPHHLSQSVIKIYSLQVALTYDFDIVTEAVVRVQWGAIQYNIRLLNTIDRTQLADTKVSFEANVNY